MKKLMIFALAIVALVSCKQTEYVTVEKVRTDTVRTVHNTRDSIWLHDSVFVSQWERGETVFIEKQRWHTRYQDRLLIDTIYESRVDSVPCPYPVEVVREVAKPLAWWQKVLMYLGGAAVLAFFIWIWRTK